MKKTILKLREFKLSQQKFSVLAAYDASFTEAINHAGIDAILVGDSLGMVIQGHSSTLPVTIDDLVYHTRAVAHSNERFDNGALIIADLPFMSYQNIDLALENSAHLMRAGANMVKLEGGAWLSETVRQLVECGIPVCGHLGLTPQSVNKLGGFKVQGKTDQQKTQLISDALALENAGADFIVLECIPTELAKEVTEKTHLSTIGIGAGNVTDAQVLVSYDMLGLGNNPARFVKDFLAEAQSSNENLITKAFSNYDDAVKNGTFPASEHEYR